MTDVQFTYEWYRTLLQELQDGGYTFRSFADDVTAGSVFLRHDVDWSPRKAVTVAELENELDVTSTFFFLVTSPFYNAMNRECREAIQRIQDLGHEIGLHFSTHQYWDAQPETEPLESTVCDEITVLSTIISGSVNVVSFHNPPEWVFRRSFEAFVSTYERRFFDAVAYRADSNQRWRDDPPFDEGIPETVQVLTHPVLWGERDGWTTDRLRKERDYQAQRIEDHLVKTDRTWHGSRGLTEP